MPSKGVINFNFFNSLDASNFHSNNFDHDCSLQVHCTGSLCCSFDSKAIFSFDISEFQLLFSQPDLFIFIDMFSMVLRKCYYILGPTGMFGTFI